MTVSERFQEMGEWLAAGLYEEPSRGLFYRKALGLRRYLEHVPLPPYHGEPLYPSGKMEPGMCAHMEYLRGFSFDYDAMARRDPELAQMLQQDFFRYRSHVPPEHTVAGEMYTHSVPHYERILREGLAAYRLRVEAMEDADMREGLLHLLCGIETYVRRCADYLQASGADARLVSALRKIPFQPAEDIYQAMVCWNLVFYLDNCDNPGRLAEGLEPWHRGENILPLLENFYDNIDVNDGYTMAVEAEDVPLTVQCLKAARGKRRPMIELLIREDTPKRVWDLALDVVRTGGGQPAFYNIRRIEEGLKARFPQIGEADLARFCGAGCTETTLAGISCIGSLDAGVNLALLLSETIARVLPACPDFETFYRAYMQAVEETVKAVTEAICQAQKDRARYNPVPMRTLFTDDCIDRERDFYDDGPRHQWSIVNFAGMINVIDAMLVIQDFVFREKRYSGAALAALLKENDDAFLREAREHPVCFGKNDPQADAFAYRLSRDVYACLIEKKTYFGYGFLPASIMFLSAPDAGRHVGATPDGRMAGEPLCDSLTAVFGKDVKGPTALLHSVASLDLGDALGIPVLNFNVSPAFSNDTLRALIQGFFQLGGIQMQITCTSPEELADAYARPELHRNLVVRVGGYSEYFCRLSDDLKRAVLKRSFHL